MGLSQSQSSICSLSIVLMPEDTCSVDLVKWRDTSVCVCVTVSRGVTNSVSATEDAGRFSFSDDVAKVNGCECCVSFTKHNIRWIVVPRNGVPWGVSITHNPKSFFEISMFIEINIEMKKEIKKEKLVIP